MKCSFVIYGQPGSKGRPRFSAKTGRTYTPTKTVEYENLVKIEYKSQCGNIYFDKDVPLKMIVTAYFQIPKSVSKKKAQMMEDRKIVHTHKPDIDNILKCISDAGNGVAYYDDSQIAEVSVRKLYSSVPRVTVVLQEIE